MSTTNTNYDTILKDAWNKERIDNPITEEQLWDLCRIFESEGMLKGNSKFVGVSIIGPFRIAYKDVSKKDILDFFATELVPALIAINKDLNFEDIYGIFLCPAALFCAKIVNNTFLIKDPLEWEILLLIRALNKKNIFPTPNEIMLRPEFQCIDRLQVYNAYKSLSLRASFFDNKQKLIEQDHDGKLECKV